MISIFEYAPNCEVWSKESAMERDKTTSKLNCSKIDEMEMLKKRGYQFRGVIGEGSYSKVKRAYSSQVGGDVAVKIIARNRAPQVFREKFLPREIEILSRVRHPNIVRVFEIFESRRRPDGDTLYIVSEFVKSGDLLEYIKDNGAMREFDGRYISHDVIRAVAYLHRHNITHRDIKCENVLLDQCQERAGLGFVAKLCDFGFARRIAKVKLHQDSSKRDALTELSQTFCGSAAYAAPEVLQRQAYDSRSADVWAIGVVIFITLYGAMPYDDTDVAKMVEVQKRDCVPTAQKKISRPGREVIRSILKYIPSSRPKVEKLLEHRWFYLENNKLSQ